MLLFGFTGILLITPLHGTRLGRGAIHPSTTRGGQGPYENTEDEISTTKAQSSQGFLSLPLCLCGENGAIGPEFGRLLFPAQGLPRQYLAMPPGRLG